MTIDSTAHRPFPDASWYLARNDGRRDGRRECELTHPEIRTEARLDAWARCEEFHPDIETRGYRGGVQVGVGRALVVVLALAIVARVLRRARP